MANKKIKYIFVHTTASGNERTREVYDISAKEIDKQHKKQGWSGIGYHYVIRLDGRIEKGRSYSGGKFLKAEEVGAHVEGLNSQSLGIALSGHGDLSPFTEKQIEALIDLLADLVTKTGIPVENVLGHSEVNGLVEKGIIGRKFLTTKTCPGLKVSMDDVRIRLRERLSGKKNVRPKDIKNAFSILYSVLDRTKHAEQLKLLNSLRRAEPFISILGEP